MVKKIVIGCVALAAAGAGVVGGRAGGVPVASVQAASPAGCAFKEAVSAGRGMLASGRADVVVAGGRLVTAAQPRPIEAPAIGGGAMVRHVATAPGRGTAYVVDRPGPDELVAITPEGTLRIEQDDEITHPTWSADGDLAWATGSAIAVRDHATGNVRRIPAPIDGSTAFSPVFLSPRRIAAVVAAPPTSLVPEGDRVDNIWVTRSHERQEWRRLTSFHTSGDRWVIVRTPVRHDGSLHFVRAVGHALATGEPRFELWRLDHRRAHRVRALPDERYLAGSRGARLLWNVPDPSRARMLLVADGPDGQRTIGCGAVIADPIDAVDPDRRARRGPLVPPRGDWAELEAPTLDHTEQIAVIVGDFTTVAAAEEAVASIRAAYPGSQVEVADSASSPFAIRPGVFGAMLHLPLDADATEALGEFRNRLSAYSATSWIVTP